MNEYSTFLRADFDDRKTKQRTVAEDFMQLVNSRAERSKSLRGKLRAAYKNKLQSEQQQTEQMNSRIARLEQMEAEMASKLRLSQERVMKQRERYDSMLNSSVYDSPDIVRLPKADLSF
jgi:exonuclease VII large subunit